MNSDVLGNAFKAIQKAEDAFDTAKHDLKGGFTLAAVSRAYYAVFYCMTGLLLLHDIHAKTHRGVQTKFRELFVKTDIFDFSVAQTIYVAFDLRQRADYDLNTDILPEEASELIKDAGIFLNVTKAYLQELKAETQGKYP
jgi:uncharacterized protein (UPF0332 family)